MKELSQMITSFGEIAHSKRVPVARLWDLVSLVSHQCMEMLLEEEEDVEVPDLISYLITQLSQEKRGKKK
jgi:hypothetical protein